MFIEKLFEYPGIEVYNIADNYYRVVVCKHDYRRIRLLAALTLFDNYEAVRLIQIKKSKTEVFLTIQWTRGD